MKYWCFNPKIYWGRRCFVERKWCCSFYLLTCNLSKMQNTDIKRASWYRIDNILNRHQYYRLLYFTLFFPEVKSLHCLLAATEAPKKSITRVHILTFCGFFGICSKEAPTKHSSKSRTVPCPNWSWAIVTRVGKVTCGTGCSLILGMNS